VGEKKETGKGVSGSPGFEDIGLTAQISILESRIAAVLSMDCYDLVTRKQLVEHRPMLNRYSRISGTQPHEYE